MNDATLATLRKLKDNNGAYIWCLPIKKENQIEYLVIRYILLPLHQRMRLLSVTTVITTSGDRGSRSFADLRELFAGNGMVGFVAKERVDGKLILPEAVKILKLKAE